MHQIVALLVRHNSMNVFIKLSALKEIAQSRPTGYYDDVITHGIVHDQSVELTEAAYRQMLIKYRVQTATGSIRGAGDLVAIPAQAIARAIDRMVGTNIQGCSGCKQRQEWMNKIIPFNK
jgi:hypothetical protein